MLLELTLLEEALLPLTGLLGWTSLTLTGSLGWTLLSLLGLTVQIELVLIDLKMDLLQTE